jgi:hypothetical protein
VDLLAADKIKIRDLVVDHVGGVGSGHGDWGLSCFDCFEQRSGCFIW